MKDENKGNLITEFIGLRPKMYSILEADGHEKKTAKGIDKKHRQKYGIGLIFTPCTTKLLRR